METLLIILVILQFNCLLLSAQQTLTSKVQRFQGYALQNSTNQTVTCEEESKCIATCLNDTVCTAIAINYGIPGKCKPGHLNRFARIQLFKATNWTTWIRRMKIKFS